MRMKGCEQERALDAVCWPGAFRHRALQPIHCLVEVAEAGVDVREMVGRDECAERLLFELSQYLSRLRRVARHSIGLSQLAQPQCVPPRDRNRSLQFGQTLILPSAEEVCPPKCGPRAIIAGV